METKKAPEKSLGNKRGLFFNIGLVLTMLMVITAFEWKFYEPVSMVDLDSSDAVYEDDLEIIRTVIPPPKRPKVVDPIIKETTEEVEDVKVDIVIDIEEFNPDIDEPVFIEPEPEIVEVPMFQVDKQPSFQGEGYMGFLKYVSKHLDYPKQAKRLNVEGKVHVAFVIDENGKIVNLQVLKGIGSGCDEEALRVLQNAPSWEPGKQRGRPVRVKMVLPITFKLN